METYFLYYRLFFLWITSVFICIYIYLNKLYVVESEIWNWTEQNNEKLLENARARLS